MNQNSSPKEGLKFEDALTQLEDIVSKLEANNISLESALKLFEDGVKLVNFCHQEINQAEEKVKILSLKNGRIQENDFIYEDGGKDIES